MTEQLNSSSTNSIQTHDLKKKHILGILNFAQILLCVLIGYPLWPLLHDTRVDTQKQYKTEF